MRSHVSWVLAAVAAGVPLVAASKHAARAHADAARAERELADASRQSGDLAALRRKAPQPALDPAGGPGLTARLGAALTRSGLAASSLVNLSPEPDITQPNEDGQLRRQRASLTLGGLTLPQLGMFLAEWARAEPAWVIASIDLSPAGGAAIPGGGDLPLRIVMSIESLRAADAGRGTGRDRSGPPAMFGAERTGQPGGAP